MIKYNINKTELCDYIIGNKEYTILLSKLENIFFSLLRLLIKRMRERKRCCSQTTCSCSLVVITDQKTSCHLHHRLKMKCIKYILSP